MPLGANKGMSLLSAIEAVAVPTPGPIDVQGAGAVTEHVQVRDDVLEVAIREVHQRHRNSVEGHDD